jgi:hypothetical protein
MRRTAVIAVACAALVTATAACQSGQDPAVDVTTTAPSTVPGETTGPTTTVASGFGTSQVSVAPAKRGLLTAVRAASQSGFDRVVFEFEDAVPGYAVSYINRPVTEDGSGNAVDVKGDSVLQVRMEPSSGVDLASDALRQTYKGPNRFTPTASVVTELVRTGDFEAVLTWVIGVKGKPGFRVNTLTGPPRLVIEIAA